MTKAEAQPAAVESDCFREPGALEETEVREELVPTELEELDPIGRVVENDGQFQLYVSLKVNDVREEYVFNIDPEIAGRLSTRDNIDLKNQAIREIFRITFGARVFTDKEGNQRRRVNLGKRTFSRG